MKIIFEKFPYVRLASHPDRDHDNMCRGKGRLSNWDMGEQKSGLGIEYYARCPVCRELAGGNLVIKRRPWIWF